MSLPDSNILPFALEDRWIVTIECERVLVNVRHRTRWYAVGRRVGHEERRHRCASREDAIIIAGYQREAFEKLAQLEDFEAMLNRLPPIQRAKAIQKIRELAEQN
jgi:hypothetical protein